MESGQLSLSSPQELCLTATLRSGQVFRWTEVEPDHWCGMIGSRRVRLQQSGLRLLWQADGPDGADLVRHFLRLDDVVLESQGARWAKQDSLFRQAWQTNAGIRVLRQEPEECFFSFLCASVAPIARISRMLWGIAREIGDDYGEGFVAFPRAETLCQLRPGRLRELGLGFRAERVQHAAQTLAALPPTTLGALRGKPLAEIEDALTQFRGVGRKIADCIALFSLDADNAIPVDTHIWRIARTQYLPELADTSLTTANYQRVVTDFAARFGPYAGWAQQILFYNQVQRSGRITS